MPQGKGTYGNKVGRPKKGSKTPYSRPNKKAKGRVTETVKKIAKKATLSGTARAGIPGASMLTQGLKAQKMLKTKAKQKAKKYI